MRGACDCAVGTVRQPVRVRIASRDNIPSITTVAYRVSLRIRGPDGRAMTFGVWVPEWSESESIAGELGAKIADVYARPPGQDTGSLHAEDPTLVHDFVLPAGCALDPSPDCFHACRIEGPDHRQVVDLEPEIRIGQISADGGRYVELRPSAGPELPDDDPRVPRG